MRVTRKSLQAANTQMAAQLATLHPDNRKTIKDKMAKLREENNSLRGDCENLAKENSRLQGKIDELNAIISEMDQDGEIASIELSKATSA